MLIERHPKTTSRSAPIPNYSRNTGIVEPAGNFPAILESLSDKPWAQNPLSYMNHARDTCSAKRASEGGMSSSSLAPYNLSQRQRQALLRGVQ